MVADEAVCVCCAGVAETKPTFCTIPRGVVAMAFPTASFRCLARKVLGKLPFLGSGGWWECPRSSELLASVIVPYELSRQLNSDVLQGETFSA